MLILQQVALLLVLHAQLDFTVYLDQYIQLENALKVTIA